jgi:hypothetical protein
MNSLLCDAASVANSHRSFVTFSVFVLCFECFVDVNGFGLSIKPVKDTVTSCVIISYR